MVNCKASTPGSDADALLRGLFLGMVMLLIFRTQGTAAQTVTVSVVPDADTFVRSSSPASNYGVSGALSVSGSMATNSAGEQNGLFDTLMRFPMSNVVATIDGALGVHDWIVTSGRLVLTESAAPDSAVFNEGVGSFGIDWIASNVWIEGAGKPKIPTNDGVAWQDLPQILNSNVDVSLGVFTNGGVDGMVSFPLALVDRFVADLRLGGELSLHLSAQSTQVGFTFNSRNFGNTNAQPMLFVTAAANPYPRIDSIELSGANVSIRFGGASNWSYILQRSGSLAGPNAAVIWTNLLTVPSRSYPTNVTYQEGISIGMRCYRLVAMPAPVF